ncbi:Uncharacterised protein [Staphylococcus aureus]|nr:Uncharacterised protein [Staphylococcus aureus]SCS91892.1 Uncharacterised protein [Staphylococcus aureus]
MVIKHQDTQQVLKVQSSVILMVLQQHKEITQHTILETMSGKIQIKTVFKIKMKKVFQVFTSFLKIVITKNYNVQQQMTQVVICLITYKMERIMLNLLFLIIILRHHQIQLIMIKLIRMVKKTGMTT